MLSVISSYTKKIACDNIPWCCCIMSNAPVKFILFHFFILASEGVYASAERREKHTKLNRKSGLQSSEQVARTASHLLILQEKSFPPRAWQECQSQVQVHGHLISNSILSQVWKEARLRHYPKLNAWILKKMEHSYSGGKVHINSRPTDYKSLISFPV